MWINEDARRMLANFENCYRKSKASPPKEQEEFFNRAREKALRRATELKPDARNGKVHSNRLADDAAWFITLRPLTIYILEQERHRERPIQRMPVCL